MADSAKIKYHLRELEIAQSPDHEGHILPELLPGDEAVLDIGCGIGQTLLELKKSRESKSTEADAQVKPCRFYGVDIDLESLQYGEQHFPDINYAHASAEELPFENEKFDFVYSRVGLPYTNIPQTLSEISRVLKPDGRIWLTMHPSSRTWRQLRESITGMKVKDIFFRSYVLINGAFFDLTGRMFRMPVINKTESFQTNKSLRRSLTQQGFSDIEITRARHFLITASKV